MSLVRRGPSPALVAQRLEQSLPRVTKENGDGLLETAKNKVHVLTGKTKGSLKVHMDSPTKGHITGQFGAWWEENYNKGSGGRNKPPHPFAAPSIEEVRPRAMARYRQAVEEAKR